jgi:hypothetical protein
MEDQFKEWIKDGLLTNAMIKKDDFNIHKFILGKERKRGREEEREERERREKQEERQQYLRYG